jgi:hypothetical protein
MIACLLEEIKEILARDKLQDEQEKGISLECTMECDDVGMLGEGLMDCNFGELCCESVGIEICL